MVQGWIMESGRGRIRSTGANLFLVSGSRLPGTSWERQIGHRPATLSPPAASANPGLQQLLRSSVAVGAGFSALASDPPHLECFLNHSVKLDTSVLEPS